MKLTIMVAASENNVIGRGGTLPWHLPLDWRRMRDRTMGHPIIMGRRTHESVGRPLPGRLNIVVTSDPTRVLPGCTRASSLAEALEAARASGAEEAFIFGGSRLFTEALPLADAIEFTRVHANILGDTFFPPIDEHVWGEIARERHEADSEHAYAFSFVTYERRK